MQPTCVVLLNEKSQTRFPRYTHVVAFLAGSSAVSRRSRLGRVQLLRPDSESSTICFNITSYCNRRYSMSQRRFASALLIVLAILLSVPFASHLGLVPKVQAITTNITLYAYFVGWNNTKPSGPNPTITVTQGDTISFTLIGGDSVHRLLLDIDNTSITTDCPNPGSDKCSGDITTTQGSSIPSFKVTSLPGTYFYYCTYHSPAYMIGKFVVKASTIPDFKIVLSSPTLTVAPGSSGSVTVTLTSLNEFSGTVSLTYSLSPLGPQVTVSPASVAVSSTGPTSSTLSVSAASSGAYSTPASPGHYNVSVTGTSGSLAHSATLALTVNSS